MTIRKTIYREQMRKVFKLAKTYLAADLEDLRYPTSRTNEFICHAIEKVGSEGYVSYLVVDEAKKIIMNRIFPFSTAANWLRNKVGPGEVDRAGDTAVQQWRHRWLDSLIVEFSK